MASIKPKTSFAPWRARTRIALVVDRGSWIANSWVVDRRVGFAMLTVLVSLSWFCRVESWVVDREFMGHSYWVCGSPIYTNSWVAAAGFGEGDERDERQGWEMRDRGERVRDEGKNKGERVDKFFFFFTILATVQFYI